MTETAPYIRGSAPQRAKAIAGLLTAAASGKLPDAEAQAGLELAEAFTRILREDMKATR